MLRTLGWCWEVWGRVPWPDPILVLHSFLWRVDFKAASEDHRLLGGGGSQSCCSGPGER